MSLSSNRSVVCGFLLLLLSLLVHQAQAGIFGPLGPPECPDDSSLRGYSTWDDIKLTLQQAGSQQNGGRFVVCPGATLDATSGEITLSGAFVTIQCGPDGHQSDNCVVGGGTRQFDITGEGAKFRGMHFRNSDSAVSVQGGTHRETVFVECVFERNDSSGFVGAAVNILSGSVRFLGVTFYQNASFLGTISVHGGRATFDYCIFKENLSVGEALDLGGAGVYVAGQSSEVSISNSCFIQNKGPSAFVFIRSTGPSVAANENNFITGNTNTQFDCQGIYDESNNLCHGFSFGGGPCGPSRPSVMPSFSPSQFSSAPSAGPTPGPTPGPSPGPTPGQPTPSYAPSLMPSHSRSPSTVPSNSPFSRPSDIPTALPSDYPSSVPSTLPSSKPSSLISIFTTNEVSSESTDLLARESQSDSKSEAEMTKLRFTSMLGLFAVGILM